ncbi:MAG TPA: thiamine pyrophosphate-dependent enzyme [Candidatus Angelobacter sp.]|nr:thiamine pyrophosphate-dependent enzyme [Candidatus Angelobacter sp.]
MAVKDKKKRTTKPPSPRPKPAKTTAKRGQSDKDEIAVLPVLNPQKLRELYSSMVKCRMLGKKVQTLSRTGTTTEPGREAVLVGAAAHLLPDDAIAMAKDGFLASFVRGTPLHSILSQALAAQDTAANTSTAQNHANGSAAQLSMATGMTLAPAMKDTGKVALVFPGEDTGAIEFHHDSLVLAAKHKLPLVCLIESNSLSGSAAVEAQFTSHDGNAETPHVPRILVDGVDAVAIFRVVQEAVRRARAGHGPSLIECLMPGDHSAHPSPGDGKEASSDPITFMEQYLRRRSLWSDEWQRTTVASFERELNEAASSEHPSQSNRNFDHVYSLDGTTSPPPISSFLERTGSS